MGFNLFGNESRLSSFLISTFLSSQIRGDLPSLHLAHNVEAVSGDQICSSNLAVGPLPRRATGHPIRHHRQVRLHQQHCPGQRHVLAAVDTNRARFRDLDHPVLCAADDDHYRAVRVDRHQAASLELADHHRQ